jgi:hypothetical protein
MLRVTFALLTVGIALFAFIDCLRCEEDEVHRWPRHLWCLIALIPLVGGIAWLVYGSRVETGGRPARGPRAPDDDPEFLRSLDRRLGHRPEPEEKGPETTGPVDGTTVEGPASDPDPDPTRERPDTNPPETS